MKARLVIFCSGGCGGSLKIMFPIANHNKMQKRVASQDWYLSVLTKPGQGKGVPLDFAPTCIPCARREMPALFDSQGNLIRPNP